MRHPDAAPKVQQHKVRLVKAVVQPVFVLDDGESLQEVTVNPIQVNAADWPEWSAKVFGPDSLAEIANQVLASEDGHL